MKTVVINAGPKRRDVNAQLAQSAAEGAKSVGSEVEYVDLYKMDLSGCHVCLICKNDEDVCKCFWRDELSPLIERIFDADSLLVAAPIFFSQPTSHYMALLERLIYSLVSYKTGNKFRGKVNVGLFYTINYPMGYFEKSVRPQLKQSEDLLEMLNGEVVIETFSNISKNMKSKSSDDELKSKEEQLSRDLERVFEIAADLSC
ncbi:MAG: flavodoxin family protein [Methanobrevibacter thaueri]|jgi:multimeric flavodoxin WrbA|uniref:Flavodoxin family protein n=1 Tax=Methanobrevibacter thaueri TaxID=190975 RepID=A0A8T3VCG0_9EURY|nr:flavodoxin family protein [Methanobrevibacter thaueri]MBE6500954.1 flavodoxin family protein [Methanobrevibacter thaueri]